MPKLAFISSTMGGTRSSPRRAPSDEVPSSMISSAAERAERLLRVRGDVVRGTRLRSSACARHVGRGASPRDARFTASPMEMPLGRRHRAKRVDAPRERVVSAGTVAAVTSWPSRGPSRARAASVDRAGGRGTRARRRACGGGRVGDSAPCAPPPPPPVTLAVHARASADSSKILMGRTPRAPTASRPCGCARARGPRASAR